MKKILLLVLMLVPQIAYAVPQAGIEYTYQTIPGNPNDIMRTHVNENGEKVSVLIPTHPTGALYEKEVETKDASGITTKTTVKSYVPDPENEDYAEYKAWLAKGNKPTVYHRPPLPPRHPATTETTVPAPAKKSTSTEDK